METKYDCNLREMSQQKNITLPSNEYSLVNEKIDENILTLH